MPQDIDGGSEMLLSPDEVELFDRQVAAQASGSVTKVDADYQNDPKGDEQCSKCERFVPGFPDDIAGYCTKVRSFRGPQGMIFDDGWCKFFEQATEEEDL